jgi:hypothetical protein
MTKIALVSLAVLTLSASVAMAAQHKTTHHRHAVKPSAAAAPASSAVAASPSPTFGTGGLWTGGVSDADRELYARNQRDSGLAGKR